MPFDDATTFEMISRAQTLGVFQIESPGQRELVGKSGIDSFADIITDISLFRPGPVKSDMITPYLNAKQGWDAPTYLHEDLRPILEQTQGVVVFHEQVIEMISRFAGVGLAEADEKRRALGDREGMAETKLWFYPRALGRGYSLPVVEAIWKVLEAFASFGFCKAHAAAFALPTYQSAWLKAHWPAHFLSGVLTHDPGMYPKRLILADARHCGIGVRGLDVNASEKEYVVEPAADEEAGYAIRLALAEVKGIHEAEVDRVVARARPVPLPHRLLAPRPGVPADRRAAGAGRGLRHRLPDRGGHRGPVGGAPQPGHPARPAAPGGRAGPVRAGPSTGPAEGAVRSRAVGVPPDPRTSAPRRPPRAAAPTPPPATRRRAPSGTCSGTPGCGPRRPPSPGRPRPRGRCRRSSSRSTSGTHRGRARCPACRR